MYSLKDLSGVEHLNIKSSRVTTPDPPKKRKEDFRKRKEWRSCCWEGTTIPLQFWSFHNPHWPNIIQDKIIQKFTRLLKISEDCHRWLKFCGFPWHPLSAFGFVANGNDILYMGFLGHAAGHCLCSLTPSTNPSKVALIIHLIHSL